MHFETKEDRYPTIGKRLIEIIEKYQGQILSRHIADQLYHELKVFFESVGLGDLQFKVIEVPDKFSINISPVRYIDECAISYLLLKEREDIQRILKIFKVLQ